jgi:hypothetical protein
MKIILAAILALSLSACALPGQLAGDAFAGLPSVQYCQKVTYTREYAKIVMSAECAIPVPTPSGLALGQVLSVVKP